MLTNALRTLLFVIASTHSMRITSPQHLCATIESPILSMRLGSQPLGSPGELGEVTVSLVPFRKACSQELSLGLSNSTYALLSVHNSYLPPEIVADIKCLEARGIAGVIVLALHFPVPGNLFYDSRYSGNDVNIPVLHAPSSKEMFAVVDHLTSDPTTPVTLIPSVTANRWREELWETRAHTIVYRIGAVTLNSIVVLIATQGLLAHLWIIRTSITNTSASWLAVLGCSIEAIAGCLRILYNAAGPFQSTPFFTHSQDAFQINTVFASGTLTTYVAAALFVRWNAFSFKGRHRRIEFLLLLVGFNALGAGLLSSALDVTIGTTITIDLIRTAVALTVVFVSAISFLIAGITLIRRLKERNTALRSRALKKAIIWMMVASAAQLIQIASLSANIVDPESLRRPLSNFVLYALGSYGLAVTAGAHTMAFRPLNHRSVIGRIMACCFDAPKSLPSPMPEVSRGNSIALVIYGDVIQPQQRAETVSSLEPVF